VGRVARKRKKKKKKEKQKKIREKERGKKKEKHNLKNLEQLRDDSYKIRPRIDYSFAIKEKTMRNRAPGSQGKQEKEKRKTNESKKRGIHGT
jgi:hypothetical protein